MLLWGTCASLPCQLLRGVLSQTGREQLAHVAQWSTYCGCACVLNQVHMHWIAAHPFSAARLHVG